MWEKRLKNIGGIVRKEEDWEQIGLLGVLQKLKFDFKRTEVVVARFSKRWYFQDKSESKSLEDLT